MSAAFDHQRSGLLCIWAERLYVVCHEAGHARKEKSLAAASDFCSFCNQVQPERKKSVSCIGVNPAIAGFLAVLLLGVSAIAASPALHELIHHDAGSPDHQCFITFFAKGHVVTATTAHGITLAPVLFGAVALLADNFLPSSTDYCFSASRAPPVRF